MPSPLLLDIDSFLQPIAADNATGNDLRTDISPKSDYSLLRDARKAARAAERMNIFDSNSTDADEQWRKVLELAPKILKTQAKDLEVACWYTEALIRKAGFQGLRDGFAILQQLIERYWDGLYPQPDEEGIETRTAPIAGLNGEGAEGVLLAPIRSTCITERIPPGPFSLWQYKQALDVQRVSDETSRNEQAAKAGFTLDAIQKAVNLSSEAFYLDLRDDVSSCLETYQRISQLLDERCGAQHSPPTSNIVNLLRETLGVINHVAKHKLPVPAADAASTDAAATGGAGSGRHAVSSGPIKTREDAFAQLHHIAQFFRKTEPHSPISYAIDKAVKWGNMSLGDLMKELIPDNNSRDVYSSLTGVTTKEDQT
jgi:type VI secretion system protein ImpA